MVIVWLRVWLCGGVRCGGGSGDNGEECVVGCMWLVCVWLCGGVRMCGCVVVEVMSVWLYEECSCMGLWVCGCLVVWVCGCRVCGCVWLYGCLVVWVCGSVVVWMCGCVGV